MDFPKLEVTNADRQATAKHLAAHRGDITGLLRRVDAAYEAARKAARDPLGWSRGTDFVVRVLYPNRRTYMTRLKSFRGVTERGAWAVAAARFFDACADLPLNVLESLGAAAARKHDASISAPIPQTFNVGALLGRLATGGVTVTLTQSGAIAIHGHVAGQVRDLIAAHRHDIAAYLSQPTTVIE